MSINTYAGPGISDQHDPSVLPLRDWTSFRSAFSQHMFSAVLDRNELNLDPDTFPFANGGVVASGYFLRELNLGARKMPGDWVQDANPLVYRQRHDYRSIQAIIRPGAPTLWTIHHRWNHSGNEQVLVFYLGSTPLLVEDEIRAMQAAEACDHRPTARAERSFRWLGVP
jgi:hypothetical protein